MITVYSKDNCPQCKQVKNFLISNDVEFKEINVMEDEESLNYIKGKGYRQLPVTEVEGQADILGFNLDRLYQLV